MKKLSFFLTMGTILLFSACQDERIDIGGPPTNVSFNIEFIDANNVRVTNQSETGLSYWDFGNGKSAEGDLAEVNYTTQGTYIITLSLYARGGATSVTQEVVITQDDPLACQADANLLFLTGCDPAGTVWKLIPEEGALWVGPDATVEGGQTWFQTSADDVNGRSCTFDDTYTFFPNGDFKYETNGDLWVEDFWEGISATGCFDEVDLPDVVAAWGSGDHQFETAEGAGPDDLSTLTVSGTGAFIGLPKAANGAEVSSPRESVTYSILSTDDSGDKKIVTVFVNFGGPGGGDWRFRLIEQ